MQQLFQANVPKSTHPPDASDQMTAGYDNQNLPRFCVPCLFMPQDICLVKQACEKLSVGHELGYADSSQPSHRL